MFSLALKTKTMMIDDGGKFFFGEKPQNQQLNGRTAN